jgi:hypothetical protein
MKDSVDVKKPTNPLKSVFGEAIEKAKSMGGLPSKYVGKIILNCNDGGITTIEKTETIR